MPNFSDSPIFGMMRAPDGFFDNLPPLSTRIITVRDALIWYGHVFRNLTEGDDELANIVYDVSGMDEFPIDFAIPEDARAFLERLKLILDPYANGGETNNGNGITTFVGNNGNNGNNGNGGQGGQLGSNARVVSYTQPKRPPLVPLSLAETARRTHNH